MDGRCLAEYEINADGGLNFRRQFGRVKDPDGISWIAKNAYGLHPLALARALSYGLIGTDESGSGSPHRVAKRLLVFSVVRSDGRSFALAQRPPSRSFGNANHLLALTQLM